ncbi:inositol monophosphatase [Halapricum sp. CBA1109]|uniref:inositol monophosphatase family protein n=1 Tax=Halapricum sp. CBA1109 TaxID=2668068 RepID=UPI0012FA3DCA|nr:inositol monophosphatase family protein [Halapricum sp. CBA1109]MUV89656.1 inositol monophosphatase [Halapricum sp. CBA1109]
MDEADRRATARAAAARGGEIALEAFRTDLAVETKDGKTDVVTRADREAQRAVVERIREAFPEDIVVGEENDARSTVPQSGAAWVIDPIDGTNNYVRGLRSWATSVAAVVDGRPVAAASVCPALGDTYEAGPAGAFRDGERLWVSDRSDPETFTVAPTIWWPFDRREEYAAAADAIVSRFGDLLRLRCAQVTLAQVAAGGVDAAITNVDTNPWDTVAGVFMVESAGGTVTDLDGEPWTAASTGLVASNGQCHETVLDAARDITPE